MCEDIGEGEDEDEDAGRECRGVLSDGRAAEPIIESPAQNDRDNGNRDSGCRRERQHGGVDQIGACLNVILNDKQQEARDPGEIGLPLEPREMVRHLARGREIFLDMIEAAAVDFPRLAAHALRKHLPAPQREIERHEIERRPDPGDARDHVAPANEEVQPVGDEGLQDVGSSRTRLPGITPAAGAGWCKYALTAAAGRRYP